MNTGMDTDEETDTDTDPSDDVVWINRSVETSKTLNAVYTGGDMGLGTMVLLGC